MSYKETIHSTARVLDAISDEETVEYLRQLAVSRAITASSQVQASGEKIETRVSSPSNSLASSSQMQGDLESSSSLSPAAKPARKDYPVGGFPFIKTDAGDFITNLSKAQVKEWIDKQSQKFLDMLQVQTPVFNEYIALSRQSQGLNPPSTNTGDNPSSFQMPPRHPESALNRVIAVQCALAPIPHPFMPSNMALERMGLPNSGAAIRGSGDNYLGSRCSASNVEQTPRLPNNENCALFLTNISVEAHIRDVFASIKTGAVFALHFNPPTLKFPTKAAKLVFMTPEGAVAYLSQINSFEGVHIHGQRIRGQYNRNGYKRNLCPWQTRVIVIEGPTELMTWMYWYKQFSKFSLFDLEQFRPLPCSIKGRAAMEFRFARIDGQAQTCLQAIRTDISLQGFVHVRYGTDPCSPSST